MFSKSIWLFPATEAEARVSPLRSTLVTQVVVGRRRLSTVLKERPLRVETVHAKLGIAELRQSLSVRRRSLQRLPIALPNNSQTREKTPDACSCTGHGLSLAS